jgi:acyl-CoA synthetase (AMP-forming)/AMP-acid ligase II
VLRVSNFGGFVQLMFHGIALLGGIVTTCNPLYTVEELTKQLKDSKAKYIITVPLFLEKVKEACKNVDISADNTYVFGQAEGAQPFTSLLANEGDNVPDVPCDPKNDIVALPYSSGTTGLAKGVMLTHYNLVSNLLQVEAREGPALQDRPTFLGLLPFFHIYGMTCIMGFGLYVGSTVICLLRFELEKFLQTVQEYKIAYLHLVPPICIALAKHPLCAKFDLTSMRSIISGAAPMGSALQTEVMTRYPHCAVRQGYGMTESSPVSHIGVFGGLAGSCGTLLPNMKCRLVDPETGKDVPIGEVGELWMAGPNVMKGYLNNPTATASTVTEDGWLRTGDMAKIDEHGNYFIVDRLKELIKYNGYQVPPAELEALLLSHPAVADTAVIGIPDDEVGELPKAYIVLKADQKIEALEIADWLAERVAPTKKLRGGIEFIDAIPKNASGKILRRVLKEKEASKKQ